MIACGGGDAAGPLAVLRGRRIAASSFSACSRSSFAARACASDVAASRACEFGQLRERTPRTAMKSSCESCDPRDLSSDHRLTVVYCVQQMPSKPEPTEQAQKTFNVSSSWPSAPSSPLARGRPP